MRRPSTTPYPRSKIAREGYPRLSIDHSGNVFLAYRTSAGDIWGPLGTTWFEHLVRFDGKSWDQPVFLGRSDGLPDQRPSLVATAAGNLLVVATTDHRFTEAEQRNSFRNDFSFDFAAHQCRSGLGTGDHDLEPVQDSSGSARPRG